MTENRYGDAPLGKSVEEVQDETGNRVNSPVEGEVVRDGETLPGYAARVARAVVGNTPAQAGDPQERQVNGVPAALLSPGSTFGVALCLAVIVMDIAHAAGQLDLMHAIQAAYDPLSVHDGFDARDVGG